jgi:peptidase E
VLWLFRATSTTCGPLVLAQDVVYVGGGSTANLLALWRLHGLDAALRDAHAAVSCWPASARA